MRSAAVTSATTAGSASVHPGGPPPNSLWMDRIPQGHRVHGVLTGPLLTRVSLTTSDGLHAWVDIVPGGGAPPGGVLTTRGSGRIIVPTLMDVVGLGPGWRLPWPACLLADVGSHGQSWCGTADAKLVGHELGVFLGRLHRGSGSGGEPHLIERLAHPPVGALAGQETWTSLHREMRHAESCTLHGEPASGHILVPLAPLRSGSVEPVAAVLGWSAPVVGDPALDVGHLIGDLIELSILLGAQVTGPDPRSVACGVLEGYPKDRGDAGFLNRVQSYAALKVIDHEARLLASGLAGGGPASEFCAALATAILAAPDIASLVSVPDLEKETQ